MADCKDYSDWYSWIEKRVCAKGNMFGTLKYFGTTHFSNGLWCGIELENPLGKNDGMVNKVRYFTCNSNFGIFIPVSKVTKLKDYPEDNFANLKEIFKIDNSSKEQAESNSVILDPKIEEEKMSNSRLGSTESLGILCLDLIDHDSSWDDLTIGFNNDFSNRQNLRENNRSSFSEPPTVSENELYDTIANPIFASTPRVSKKRLVACGSDSDDNVDVKSHLIDKFTFDVHSQEFFFDVDKLKNSPNLTSTYKNLPELTSILNNPEISPILLGNKIVQQSETLENSQDFSNKEEFSQNSNEILGKTFELHNLTYSPTSCAKQNEKILNNNNGLNITTIIEDIKSTNLDKNSNATFELQCPINTSLNLSFEEKKDLTFDLKKNITQNFDKSNADSQNVLNTTSVLENLNSNATFELEQQKIPDKETEKKTFHSRQIKIENPSSNFNECGAVVTNKNVVLEKAFVFDLSTICECKESKIQNESFNYKKEFLKETDSFQSSTQLNYRNSICLPLNTCNELHKSVRRSSSVSSYPSCREKENNLEVTGHKSSINRGRVSSLKDLPGNTDVFKKPFSPNSTLRNSKVALKSHSSLNTKENRNKTSNKESNIFPRHTFLKNTNKVNINTNCKKNEITLRSKQIKSSFNIDMKSEFSKLKSCNSKNSSSKTVSNLALPLKNKLNCDNLKQSPSSVSKLFSKTAPISKITKNSIVRIPTATKIVDEDSVKDNVIKNSKSQLKMQSLDSTFIAKNDNCDSLPKSNFPASSLSNKVGIPKRSSLVPCFKSKPPVGIIKPLYSKHQAKNDVILENLDIEKGESSQTSKVTEKNLNEINLQSNVEINNSLKECAKVGSSKNCSNMRQLTGLPKKIKSKFSSPSNQKPESKPPLKKVGGIPTGPKIPRLSQNLKKL